MDTVSFAEGTWSAFIRCSTIYHSIVIQSAIYVNGGSCAKDVTSIIRNVCDKLSSCDLSQYHGNGAFGDPCDRVPKSITIKYFCNTNPSSTAFEQDVLCKSDINFMNYLSDSEDPSNMLKIKIISLPTLGSLQDSSGNAVVVGGVYDPQLNYKAKDCDSEGYDMFNYVSRDTFEYQSVSSTVTLHLQHSSGTTSPDASTDNFCLNLKKIILGSVGDIDRNNEEIEFEIKSGDTQLNCGLFLFDIVKNVKDKNLNIKIPCVKGEFVDIRVIERDVCNDDMTLESIECESTEGLSRLEIKISADATSTSYTQCVTASNQVQDCVDASVGEVIQVGGELCDTRLLIRAVTLFKRLPSMLLDEPTILNKERMGQCSKA
ncbi:MAG: hypothetical protein K2P53_05670 [Rickettsiales bacterium]|nr:hypothetical protein [Rickettsiales bacterium]